MKPTISVIIPFHNRADLLAETLDSILAQTFTDFELIGVDDGSTDNALQIFKDYAKHDARFKLYTKRHTNAGDARNLGYKHSRGDYLLFLDSDDLFESDFFATMLNTIRQENSDIAACVADEFDHYTKKTTRVRQFTNLTIKNEITTLTSTDLRPNLFTVMLPAIWNRIFKRSLVEQYHLRFQSQVSSNDMYFSFAALIYSNQITFINRTLVHHRVNDQRSLSNLKNQLTNKIDICTALDHLRKKLPTKVFVSLKKEYYTHYLQKTLEAIMRSNFIQGKYIFSHSRTVLKNITTITPCNNDQTQLLHAFATNDFATFYCWLRQNKLLLVDDNTADAQIRKISPTQSVIKITILIYHLTDGGAERAVTLWAKILSDAGYQVTVLTYYPRDNEYPLDNRVIRANLMSSYEEYLACEDKTTYCKSLLQEYLTTHSPDLSIPSTFRCHLSATICARKGLKVIQTIRNSPWDKEQGFKLSLRDWAIQRQGSVILQNAEQAEYFNTPLFKHVKKYIVHNPLNPQIMNIKKEQYRELKKIAAVGRLVPQKNHALMIETIRVLRDEYHENYELDIFGTGELEAQLQKQINDNHLNNQVKLCGRQNNIFNILLNYDLFFIASAYEGIPNALLEAMGLGLPALAIKCRTGITELIKNDKNGYIIDNYDAKALAKKIHEINNKNQLERIGKQARKDMITRYSIDKIQAELTHAIESLLKGKEKLNRATLANCQFTSQEEYQYYFEYSFRLIKMVDKKFGKQIFNHVRHTLKAAKDINVSPSKKIYYTCLCKNNFKRLYHHLHNKRIGL